MHKQLNIFLLLLLVSCSVFSQSGNNNRTSVSKDIFVHFNEDTTTGVMNILQDPSLHVLMDKNSRISKKSGTIGFRIQIYSGSGINAREKANKHSIKFTTLFPEFDTDLVYFDYKAPYFKLLVGDFRNRSEAFELYNQIKKEFSGAYIVKTRIRYPKL